MSFEKYLSRVFGVVEENLRLEVRSPGGLRAVLAAAAARDGLTQPDANKII